MRDVKIKRHKVAAEMKFRIVVQRAAVIILQPLFERPADDVAQGVKIKMQIVGNGIIEAEIVVVNRVAMHHAQAEGDCTSMLTPDEETRPFRHRFSQLTKII